MTLRESKCSGETETQWRAEGLPEDTQPQWWAALTMLIHSPQLSPHHLPRIVPALAPLPPTLPQGPLPSVAAGQAGSLFSSDHAVGAHPLCSKPVFLLQSWCGRWHSRTERRFIFDSKRTSHKCTALAGRGGGSGAQGSRVYQRGEPRTQPVFKSQLGHLWLCALRYPVFPPRASTSALVKQSIEAQRPSLIRFTGFIKGGDAHVEEGFGAGFHL